MWRPRCRPTALHAGWGRILHCELVVSIVFAAYLHSCSAVDSVQTTRVVAYMETATEVSHKEDNHLQQPLQSGGLIVQSHRTYCHFRQLPELKGTWVPHQDPDYMGMYNQRLQCPDYAYDFDCLFPNNLEPTPEDAELLRQEYNQVVEVEGCELHPWSPEGFMRCMSGRRLILIGDSLMRQTFHSLACMLASVSTKGSSGLWDSSTSRIRGNFTARGCTKPILKQFIGDFVLENGATVHIRSFGQFNITLWDLVMEEFGLLTERDVLMVNFGAWYPRFKAGGYEGYDPWHYFKVDMHELIYQRLKDVRAAVYWKEYSPTHFGGRTGTFTGIDEEFPDILPPLQCSPASHGEFWYNDYIRAIIRDCGLECAHIRVLPIFHLSLPRYNLHHGTFGRGLENHVRDCRHFCQPVVDFWNVVLYNMECFNNAGPPNRRKKKKAKLSDLMRFFKKGRRKRRQLPDT